MQENDECFRRPPVAPAAVVPVAAQPTEPSITPAFVKEQAEINTKIISEMKTLSQNVDKLLDVSRNMMEYTEVTFKASPSTQEMLSKIDERLLSYSEVTPAPPVIIQPANNTVFENKVIQMIENVNTGLLALKDVPKNEPGLSLADKEFIQHLNNETLNALEHVKAETLEVSDKG